ncbi:prepilin-type N-terminal cleavage/methylation domain-containing protein [Calidithermus roseus]|uniref:prepilin-type N-terminal cleavage/methylation domain-containing protein n=1 Tax=Calidithermus roseus TaxID=1644118 RepID=UPI000E64EBA4|nr:prepilin-type N-terminal cleavage/methylation domain-containing protein [Calidithermus roseus]
MRKHGGFTLIELLIVIAVIATLAAVLILPVTTARKRAQNSGAQTFARQVAGYVESYLSNPLNSVAKLTGGNVAGSHAECSAADGGALQGEGLSSTYPAPVEANSCFIVNDGNGGYGIQVQAATKTYWTIYNGLIKEQASDKSSTDPATW